MEFTEVEGNEEHLKGVIATDIARACGGTLLGMNDQLSASMQRARNLRSARICLFVTDMFLHGRL